MSSPSPGFRRFRRSTRVPLKVVIETRAASARLTCEAETIVVNLHGALIATPVPLAIGIAIELRVFLTGKKAEGKVVYVDPAQPLHCGIELAKPENIWGISLPPEDWHEADAGR